jgi:hypothetical protein
MRFADWKSETSRGIFKPRSAELKALDRAIEDAGDTKTCGMAARIRIAKRLKDWVDAQALNGRNWSQSTRNSTTDVLGRGTVERLIRDLMTHGECGSLQTLLNAIPAVAAPVTDAYSPGKWDRSRDDDGHWYDYIRQEKGNSCVCATIVMVKRAVHNLASTDLREEQIRGILALEEAGKLNSGISALSDAAQNHHDWDNVGTGPTRAVKALQKNPYPVPTARILPGKAGQDLLNGIRKFTRKTPGLIGWRWSSGGHFTMCVGPTDDGSRLVIIDPWTGINYVDNSLTGFTSYSNGQGTLGDVIATN